MRTALGRSICSVQFSLRLRILKSPNDQRRIFCARMVLRRSQVAHGRPHTLATRRGMSSIGATGSVQRRMNVAASNDYTASIWDAVTGNQVRKLVGGAD